jgi:CheY-like chemotaxis protein
LEAIQPDPSFLCISIQEDPLLAEESILVVDDDEFMVELLNESLTDAGYSVVTAANGAEATDILNHQDLHIALIDLSLPDMSGMDLVAQVTNASPDAQIIIMTGYPTIESVIDSLREGAQDYIVKPFKVPEVLAAVSRSLKNQKLQTEVRELRRRVRDLELELQRPRLGAAPAGGTPRPTSPRPAGLAGAYGGVAARRPPQGVAPEPVPVERESPSVPAVDPKETQDAAEGPEPAPVELESSAEPAVDPEATQDATEQAGLQREEPQQEDAVAEEKSEPENDPT